VKNFTNFHVYIHVFKSTLDSLMTFIDGLGNSDGYDREKAYAREELS
jgi:hypothetical protein